MVAMLVNNPLVEQLDLTSLRVLSCGGSPQSPAGAWPLLFHCHSASACCLPGWLAG
jgi:hypothetical protein